MASVPKPAGYDALVAKYGIQTIPHWHRSAVAATNTHQTHVEAGRTLEVFPAAYAPHDTLGEQLEFALKYDGTNLAVLAAIFEKADPTQLVEYIQSTPTGKYARRLWYLYELLTGKRLPLVDLATGTYVDLLESDRYYTAEGVQVRRQRVNDNLLGNAEFCPLIRRTEALLGFERMDLPQRCRDVLAGFPPDILRRALSYLYTKETRSSFEIEEVQLDAGRIERFVALLQLAQREDFFSKPALIDLQNRIVDERFRDQDYRKTQNYVGESVGWQRQQVHFIAPKPEDLGALMQGMFQAHARMGSPRVHPIIHAAAVAFGFVFMHPFEDGNGRIHRFLIHNILARREFTPAGVIFPVSAAMLQNPGAYDAALEAFSKELLPLVEYTLDDDGHMSVLNETARYYRYLDLTPQAEALFGFVKQVIETDLAEELRFLQHYDRTKRALQSIVDMPDRLIDLFIRLCLQNKGTLSAGKRSRHFAMLTDEEVQGMQDAFRKEYLE